MFLHIILNFTNIKIVLASILIFLILIIFPIFLNIKIFFSWEIKKLFFLINIFGIKCLSGYFEILSDCIAIHLTDKFAIIIPLKNLLGMRTRVKPLKDYHFVKFNSTIEIGSKESLISNFAFAFIINYFYNFTLWFLSNSKPYINFNNKINLYQDNKKLNIIIDSTVIFNILMVLISIIKIIMEKIVYAFRNKKQQNRKSS